MKKIWIEADMKLCPFCRDETRSGNGDTWCRECRVMGGVMSARPTNGAHDWVKISPGTLLVRPNWSEEEP